jgi:DNA-binding CsgD family transcriptional regulator
MPVVEGELLEREAELAEVHALIGQARSGRGRAFYIEGPAGIGKTRLLHAVRERASAAGMHVLMARGSELEREYAFGVVRQLLEPPFTAASSRERQVLLQGAAALAEKALAPSPVDLERPDERGASSAWFPTLHGLYWLTSNLAEHEPLALLVDDAHWADSPSLRFIAFLMPRLEELPMLLVIARRTGDPASDPEAIERVASDPLTVVVRPDPLSAEGVGELVRVRVSSQAEDSFCRACHEVTGGNPFLVHQLLLALKAEGIQPTSDAAAQVRSIAPKSVGRAVLLNLARLGDQAAQLARAVAVLGDGVELYRAALLADLDIQEADEAAHALRDGAIFSPDRLLAFVHPLVRAAVYSELEPVRRSRLHGEAARLLAEQSASAEEVASHLLAADPTGDPWVAEALRRAGREAAATGALGAAITYLRRALEEPPPSDAVLLLRLELGELEVRQGEADAIARLREALGSTDDPELLERYAPFLAGSLNLTGRPEEAVAELERLRGSRDPRSAEMGLRTEAELIALGQVAAPTARLAAERLARFEKAPEGRTAGEKLVLAAMSLARAKAGRPADEAAALAETALAGGELLREVGPESMAYWNAVWVLLATDRLQGAERAIEQALEHSRARGMPGMFIVSTTLRSRLHWLRGDVGRAEADARSAVDVARLHDFLLAFPHSLAYLLDAMMERGEVDASDGELAASGIGETIPEGHLFDHLLFSRGRLRLAQGKLRDGIDDLLEVGRRKTRWGMANPFDTPWASSTAPALVALGEHEQARRVVEEELAQSRIWRVPRNTAIALRATALIADGSERLRLLEEAAAMLADGPARLERARTLVDLASALRDSHRAVPGREALHEALKIARRCGAFAIARQAHQQLEAMGERLPQPVTVGADVLSPSERRVAEIAAKGLSNREIAQELFVTLKTVEKHLSATYRKLEISSRDELSTALSR